MPPRKREARYAAPIWIKRNGVMVAIPNTYGAVHGKRGTYVYRRCRCDACREAERVYQASRPKKERTPADLKAKQHGTVNAYIHYGCKCRPCKDAIAAYRRHRRKQ